MKERTQTFEDVTGTEDKPALRLKAIQQKVNMKSQQKVSWPDKKQKNLKTQLNRSCELNFVQGFLLGFFFAERE